MPPNIVVDSIIVFIKNYKQKNIDKDVPPLVNVHRPTKNTSKLDKKQTTSESLLNSFIYSYLVYMPSMFDMLFDQRNLERNQETNKIYKSMYQYLMLFKSSRNPFTVCWLLELLNILTIKFELNERHDKRIKTDFYQLLNTMLHNCVQIVQGTFNI